MNSARKICMIIQTFFLFVWITICSQYIYAKQLQPSAITCILSDNIITVGDVLSVSGKIEPLPTMAHTYVHVRLTSPAGESKDKITTAENGVYTCDFLCTDITSEGKWIIGVSWAGEYGSLERAECEKSFEVSRAGTRLVLDVSSRSIFPGESVAISGNISVYPECDKDMSDIPVELSVLSPDGTSFYVTPPWTDQNRNFSRNYSEFSNSFGEWKIRAAVFRENNAYHSAEDTVTVNVVETAGYAIIIQGRVLFPEGLESHNKTTTFVCDTLKQRGFQPGNIMYFGYNAQNEDTPSKNEVRKIITEWAKDRMTGKPANLYIIMAGHGEKEKFYIYPDTITSEDFAGWLDTLQQELSDQKVVVILGFSGSGSFIDDLSRENRIIIASTDSDELSFRGPEDIDAESNIPRDGEYFVTEFFKSASFGKSVKQCFEDAVSRTESYTLSDEEPVRMPYYDGALQHPLLDDNGDKQGSNDLSRSGKDGLLSNKCFIGAGSKMPDDVLVTEVADTIFLDAGESKAKGIWAKVNNKDRVKTIWIEIKPPGYMAGVSRKSKKLTQVEMDGLTKIIGSYSGDRYHWNGVEGNGVEGFSEPGTYQVFYYARDKITGNVSSLMETKAYKAKQGNLPPEPVELLFPPDKVTMPTTVLLDWKDATDTDGDMMSYTVFISKNDPEFLNPIQKQGLMASECLVTPSDGIEQFSTYYWKVRAIDVYGSFNDTEEVREFYTGENVSPETTCCVKMAADPSQKITDAVVVFTQKFLNQEKEQLYINDQGCYTADDLIAGEYSVQITGNRYSDYITQRTVMPMTETKIEFSLYLKGDIDKDGSVDLDDVRKTLGFVGEKTATREECAEIVYDDNSEIPGWKKCIANVYNDDNQITENDVRGVLRLSWGDDLSGKVLGNEK